MIQFPEETVQGTDAQVKRWLRQIKSSGVCALLEPAGPKAGPTPHPAGGPDHQPKGIRYSAHALLLAIYINAEMGRRQTIASILEVLLFWLNPTQLALLGMHIPETDRRKLDHAALLQQESSKQHHPDYQREYQRFYWWQSNLLQRMDARKDLPAIRQGNAERDAIIRARTPETLQTAQEADEFSALIMNKIIAASVDEPCPRGYRGDVVIDETIFDSAASRNGREGNRGSASPTARHYVRAKGTVQDKGAPKSQGIKKSAHGVGATAVIRVGPPGSIRAITPVFTGVAFHEPTSGSVEGADIALEHHQRNGFDQRPGGHSARRPMIIADMGYPAKKTWAEMVFRRGYTSVIRYPQSWHLIHESENPAGDSDTTPPGALLAHGSFYCPAAVERLRTRLIVRVEDLTTDAQFDDQDQRLAEIFPTLMGINKPLHLARSRPGRPAAGTQENKVHKIELVCPAAQLRCRCPLKPESLNIPAGSVPTLAPTWQASERKCCAQTFTTITLTPKQFSQYQQLPPGSWEHASIYEVCRALNERYFGSLKSPYWVNLTSLNSGPRREPLQKLVVAISMAVTNRHIQRASKLTDLDTYTTRLKSIDTRLGRRATRVPPLT